ncbi:hypothetical protein BD414DRAFT_405632, partial [Trametes punicea]
TSFVEEHCDIAAFVLVFYEYTITFDREVALVWGKKLTGATILFVLNRYLALLKYPICIVGLQPISDAVRNICSLLTCMQLAAFSRLRVYAIAQQSWPMALVVAVLDASGVKHCYITINRGSTANYPLPIGLLIATRVSAILTDVLILLITWWQTYDLRRLTPQTSMRVSLGSLLLRDGE